jgi:hypothetical protein
MKYNFLFGIVYVDIFSMNFVNLTKFNLGQNLLPQVQTWYDLLIFWVQACRLPIQLGPVGSSHGFFPPSATWLTGCMSGNLT